ncbi:DNA-binding protein [Synechococcus sp. Nb3U1]|uniref:DNA-binding protein n=1 Tax=Synechococcus sp. Nb3U1 TaxID=1914529 RepID=UPI001F4770BD|nr:DNA-binding protein [Synechococcus sp. Nb3U1]MCF2971726.1 DNA-binding protein [Synechococcus sp. Nb3U1]
MMNRTLNPNHTRLLPLLVLLTPLLLVSPAAAQRGRNSSRVVQQPQISQPAVFDQRTLNRAGRDLAKAERSLLQAEFFAQRLSSSEAATLTELGRETLQEARASFQAGDFFAAREAAKAADNLFKAANALYEGETGYMGHHSSRSFFEAPFRAQENLTRLKAELAYYGNSDSRVSELMQQAEDLLSNVNTAPGSYSFKDFAQSRAARHTARAALHLMASERGF